MPADLPKPDVTVTTSERPGGGTDLNVVISRDGKSRAYTADQTGGGIGAVKGIVEQIIADPVTPEWQPAGKRY